MRCWKRPSEISREWVDAARDSIKDSKRQSANGDRSWELSGGVLLCTVYFVPSVGAGFRQSWLRLSAGYG